MNHLTPTMCHVADECQEIRLSGAMIPIWQIREIAERSAMGSEPPRFAGDTTQEPPCKFACPKDPTMPKRIRTHTQDLKALGARKADDRPTAAARGYGTTWRKLRRLKLNRSPVCETPGCGRIATDVDHVVPLARGGSNMMDNLQSLCHSCHSRKTAVNDGGFGHG